MANQVLTNEGFKDFFGCSYACNEGYDGYVPIKVKSPDGSMSTVCVCKASELSEKIAGKEFGESDYYISKNRFNNPFDFSSKCLFGLSNIVIDIDDLMAHGRVDCAFGVIEAEKLIDALMEEFHGKLHSFNYCALTGRGIQLWWALEPCPNLHWLYKLVVNMICNTIEDVLSRPCFSRFHLDRAASENPAGLVRLPGTFNTKAKTTGMLIAYHEDRLGLDDFKDELEAGKEAKREAMDEAKAKAAQKEKEKPDLSNFRFVKRYGEGAEKCKKTKAEHAGVKDVGAGIKISPFTANGLKRAGQLENLVKSRAANGGNMGFRNEELFIYAATVEAIGKHTAEEIMSLAMDFNQLFEEPLPTAEIKDTVNSVINHKYKFTNETIISRLAVTPEEQDAIGLKAVKPGSNRFGKQLTKEEHEQKQAEYNEKMCNLENLLNAEDITITEAARRLGYGTDWAVHACRREGIKSQQMKRDENCRHAIRRGKSKEQCMKYYKMTPKRFDYLARQVAEEDAKAKAQEEADKAGKEARKKELKEKKEKEKAEKEKRKKERRTRAILKRAYGKGMGVDTAAKKAGVSHEVAMEYYKKFDAAAEKQAHYAGQKEMRQNIFTNYAYDITKSAEVAKKIEAILAYVKDNPGTDFTAQINKSIGAIGYIKKKLIEHCKNPDIAECCRWEKEKLDREYAGVLEIMGAA